MELIFFCIFVYILNGKVVIIMIKEIGSYKFPGFYESLFCNCEEFLDDESEMKFEVEQLIQSKDFFVEYEYEDFSKYKINVCNKYMEFYIEKIIDVLPYDITNHEDFIFEQVDYSTVVESPKYYNYRTDYCYCEIETNRKTLKLIKEWTLKLEDSSDYIKKHFTSRDGFISFVSNNIDIWKETDIEDYEQNMLIALLDMLISLSDCTGFEEIALRTYYEIDKYCYASPVIYYREKDNEIAKNDIKILEENNFEIKRLSEIK